MRIEDGIKLDFDDVLLRPKRSTLGSRAEVLLERTFTFRHGKAPWTGVPIIASNMDGVGTLEMAEKLSEFSMFTTLAKSVDLTTVETIPDVNHFSISIGIKDADVETLHKAFKKHPNMKFITIDVANGYSERFGDFIEKVRGLYPEKIIIAGNVVTADMTQELVLRGADIVKVGIGPGSVCTTRIKTGVGYPQLSAIIECADAAHGLGAQIIADGGCKSPGDVAKAFAAGADFVMLGGMFAGHDEGIEGRLISEKQDFFTGETKKVVTFYGMSSDTAMDIYNDGMAWYRSSEGRTVQIPYRGNVEHTVRDILGGLRSTCTYIGATKLKDVPKCTSFIRVNKQYNDVFEKHDL